MCPTLSMSLVRITFCDGDGARVRRLRLSEEVRDELVHPRVRQQQAGLGRRDQRRGAGRACARAPRRSAGRSRGCRRRPRRGVYRWVSSTPSVPGARARARPSRVGPPPSRRRRACSGRAGCRGLRARGWPAPRAWPAAGSSASMTIAVAAPSPTPKATQKSRRITPWVPAALAGRLREPLADARTEADQLDERAARRLLHEPRQLLDAPHDLVGRVEHDVDAVDLAVGLLDRGLDLSEQRHVSSRIASIGNLVLSRTRNVLSSTKHRNRTRSTQPTASTMRAMSPPVRARTGIPELSLVRGESASLLDSPGRLILRGTGSGGPVGRRPRPCPRARSSGGPRSRPAGTPAPPSGPGSRADRRSPCRARAARAPR